MYQKSYKCYYKLIWQRLYANKPSFPYLTGYSGDLKNVISFTQILESKQSKKFIFLEITTYKQSE